MNLRPSGYEPDELPDCSTPREVWFVFGFGVAAFGAVEGLCSDFCVGCAFAGSVICFDLCLPGLCLEDLAATYSPTP